MKKKPVILLVAVVAIFALVYAANYLIFQHELIDSSESPNGDFRAELLQERGGIGFVERLVRLRVASRNQEVFDELIYTGDFLDSEFKELYPLNEWTSPSTLFVGVRARAPLNEVNLMNESDEPFRYILVETNRQKILILDLGPGQNSSIRLNLEGFLSATARPKATDTRLDDAVSLAGISNPSDSPGFSINLGKNSLRIESPGRTIEHVDCCAPDRPRPRK